MYPLAHLLGQPLPAAPVPTDLSWWAQYGPLGVAVAVFAVVIAYLFRLMRGDQKEIALERAGFAAERERLKLEYETKHLGLSKDYAQALVAELRQSRENELEIRRENADKLEGVAERQEKTADQLALVMGKLADKIAAVSQGPKGRYGG